MAPYSAPTSAPCSGMSSLGYPRLGLAVPWLVFACQRTIRKPCLFWLASVPDVTEIMHVQAKPATWVSGLCRTGDGADTVGDAAILNSINIRHVNAVSIGQWHSRHSKQPTVAESRVSRRVEHVSSRHYECYHDWRGTGK